MSFSASASSSSIASVKGRLQENSPEEESKEILLLGSTGLLGRHLREEFLRRQIPVLAPAHREIDICDVRVMAEILDTRRFWSVINAAAFCSFAGCEDNPEKSRRTNLEAPIQWGLACAERGQHFVQFSSDYIFDGTKDRPYVETDPARPLNVYGRHKAQVEETLLPLPGILLLRVAWLFGVGGKTFLSLLPRLLLEQEGVRVASGKKGSCLHVGLAARVIADLVERRVSGRFNLAHRGATAWEIFAAECLQEWHRRGGQPRCQHIEEVPFTELPHGQGQRPSYSVLETSALEKVWGQPLPPWQEGLRAYMDQLIPAHSSLPQSVEND